MSSKVAFFLAFVLHFMVDYSKLSQKLQFGKHLQQTEI